MEASLLTKSGELKPYFFTGRRVVFNGAPCLVGMGIDISERKKTEQALRQSEAKLRVIFEQAPLGIAVLNSKTGQFRKLNPQYCRITGYSEAEMLGLISSALLIRMISRMTWRTCVASRTIESLPLKSRSATFAKMVRSCG